MERIGVFGAGDGGKRNRDGSFCLFPFFCFQLEGGITFVDAKCGKIRFFLLVEFLVSRW